jgi:predicted transcriptional regulator YdeE
MMKQVKIEGFAVSGSSVRTNNLLEAGSSGKILGLWERFYTTNPQPTERVYGVYSNYESDASGDFTVTVGVAGDRTNISIGIESGNYLAFPVNGTLPAAIIAGWKTIWEHFSQEHSYIRSYQTDFEEYSGIEAATIYIGIEVRS